MPYDLEALGPDRFQELCQSLLTLEYPGIQCYPVGMADGGRDASAAILGRRDSIIFQVKFSRNPSKEQDPAKWLENAVAAELPKITKLIAKGAKSYALLTNVPGTAIPGRGTIDLTAAMLSSKISIPSQCLWRSDLERRIDSHSGVRGAYPDLITGSDILLALLESDLTEHADRRKRAITAFLSQQLSEDETVKFRQAELQNYLLKLFVDVPVDLSSTWSSRSAVDEMRTKYSAFLDIIRNQSTSAGDLEPLTFIGADSGFTFHGGEGTSRTFSGPIGAASFLLNRKTRIHFPNIVLEGSPGQGKSTLTQYLCQVHRLRLLARRPALNELPAEHLLSPLRIPFRIELSSLSSWLTPESEEDLPFTREEIRTFETYLAYLVQTKSGGLEFRTADLLQVFASSSVLLVLDGLDEVPDVASRQRVIDEVSIAIERLRSNAPDIQVVITSRPSVFNNSPGFARANFTHFNLTALGRHHITQYADKWMTARSLDAADRAMVENILNEKLDQPHMRDLARNPMQLAILLHLIVATGAALPDRRTELYDDYIKMLFAREADKSTVVRDNRQLLMAIHGYLAWILHCDAEVGASNGRIGESDLAKEVRHYLETEGHSTEIVDQLFEGVIDRVCALVKRTEGLYEFEVQPLREYFCARYLYNTAQYAPSGRNRPGTLLERFDGIARNPYWLNVTRFYAGCYSKGELASLCDSLDELTTDNVLRYTAQPRTIMITLLADWVFALAPKASERVVSRLLEGFGERDMLELDGSYGHTADLPPDCGGRVVGLRAMDLLAGGTHKDRRATLLNVAKQNLSHDELMASWRTHATSTANASQTLSDGVMLGTLQQAPPDELTRLVECDTPDDSNIAYRLSLLASANRGDILEHSDDWAAKAQTWILEWPQLGAGRWAKTDSEIGQLGALAARFWNFPRLVDHILDGRCLKDSFNDIRYEAQFGRDPVDVLGTFTGDSRLLELLKLADEQSERPLDDWVKSVEPWSAIVSAGIGTFGESWLWRHVSAIAAGIRNSGQHCTEYNDLLDPTAPMTERYRYARLRAGSAKWWIATLEQAQNESDIETCGVLLLAYGSLLTLAKASSILASKLHELDEIRYMRMLESITNIREIWNLREDSALRFSKLMRGREVGARVALSLADRVNRKVIPLLLSDKSFASNGERVRAKLLMSTVFENPDNTGEWNSLLDLISGLRISGGVWYPRRYYLNGHSMPLEIARSVIDNASDYPPRLIETAESSFRRAYRPKPVLDVATSQKWFDL